MFKLFMGTTDNFLCNNLKAIFEKTETKYKDRNLNFNLFKELESLKLNALVSKVENGSDFEKSIKSKLKILLGIYFVAIPFLAFILVTFIFSFAYDYAFILTFTVAILATVRMDSIIHKYAHYRCARAGC